MGYFQRFITGTIVSFILIYLLYGLFNPAEAYYPQIILWVIPESLHETRLWESVFLSNFYLWTIIFGLASIYAASKLRLFKRLK